MTQKARPAVYVQGGSISTGWADASRDLGELIFLGVTAALADAGLVMDDVDSVVLASHDLVDGRSLSSMVTAPAAGAYLRDEIRLTEDGLVAVSLGAARIEAGESVTTLVAAWGRASEGDYQHVSRWSFDPFLVQPFAIDEFSLSAFRLADWLNRHPGRDDDRQRAGAARLARAKVNPRAVTGTPGPTLGYPVTPDEGPRFADIVVATVLGIRPSAVRIAGLGHGTDLASPGDRVLAEMTALRDASALALGDAAMEPGDIDLLELAGATLCDDALSLEALGFAAPGDGFAVYAARGEMNPSGGGAAGWCHPANGLRGFVEAYLQLTGAAGASQLASRPRTALVTGVSPPGAQTGAAVVLSAR